MTLADQISTLSTFSSADTEKQNERECVATGIENFEREKLHWLPSLSISVADTGCIKEAKQVRPATVQKYAKKMDLEVPLDKQMHWNH